MSKRKKLFCFACVLLIFIVACGSKLVGPHPPEPTPPPLPEPPEPIKVPKTLSDAITAETLKQFAELAEEMDIDKGIADGWRARRELYLEIDGASEPLPENLKNLINSKVQKFAYRLKELSHRSNPVLIEYRNLIKELKKPSSSGPSQVNLTAPVYFSFDSDIIKKEDEARIEKIAKIIKNVNFPVLLVVRGHTDPIGTDEYNLDLAKRRISSVVSILKEGGLYADNYRVENYGKSRPVVPDAGKDAPGAVKNRRVSFGLGYK